jgi:hypothetical protein
VKKLFSLAILSVGLLRGACSISVASPTAAQSITLTPPTITFNFTPTITTCPNIYSVDWQIDGESVGFAYGPTFVLPINLWDLGNGPRSVVAVAHDAISTDAALATSAAVAFTIANTTTYSNGTGTFNAGVSVSPSCTSNCSGVITFTLTYSGSWDTTRGMTRSTFVDGQLVFQSNPTSSSPNGTVSVDTRAFFDGSHILRISTDQGIDHESHIADYQIPITFLNSPVFPTELFLNAREVFLQPAGTATFSGTVYNTDRSVVSSPTIVYYSQNTAIATINQTTGVTNAVGTAPNSVQIGGMASTTTGSLTLFSATQLNTAAAAQWMVGNLIEITGGSGCNANTFAIIASVGTGSNINIQVGGPSLGTLGSTCTFATGPSRFAWVRIAASNAVAHFSRAGGAVLASYDPAASFWHASMFQHAQTFNTYPKWCSDFSAAGWNGLEFTQSYGNTALSGWPGASASGDPHHFGSITQAAWTTNQTNYVTAMQTAAQNCNSYLHLIGDPWWRGDNEMYDTVRGVSVQGAGAWATAPLTLLTQSWANILTCTPTLTNKCYGGVIAISRYDEYSSTWRSTPLSVPISFAAGNLTSIVASGGTCTANWPTWALNGSNKFIIHGATTAAFNIASPTLFTATGTSLANSFTFACAGVADGTYNSSTDAGLVLERFGAAWHNTTDYVPNSAFQTIRTWTLAATGTRPLHTWTNPAATSTANIASVTGNPNMADYNSQYFASNDGATLTYAPNHAALFSQIGSFGDLLRSYLPDFQDGKPIEFSNVEGLSAFYTFAGYPLTVSATSGNVVTTSTPHGISTALSNTTRAQLSAMSVSADNGKYYIITSPTATTLALFAPTVVVSTATTNGTITFQNGDSYSGLVIQNLSNASAQRWALNDSANGCIIATHRGMTFTISGTGTVWDSSGTYYYPPTNVSDTPCTNNLQGGFFLIPNLTSTSGTITITPDNWPHRGISNVGTSKGPLYDYVAHLYPAIMGAAAVRTYPVVGYDPQFFNYGTTTTQSGVGPGSFSIDASFGNNAYNDYSDFGGEAARQFGPYTGPGPIGPWTVSWWADGMANIQNAAKVKWLFKPFLASPDIGSGFECTARGDAGGNLVLCQSFWNATTTMTISTSAYLQSGQGFIKDHCTITGCTTSLIASGTTSVAETCEPGCTVWLRFPTNATAEWSAPVISMRLADISNATDIVVQYAYAPFPMNAPVGQPGLNSVDCLTGAACALPTDLHISTLYYRIIYRSASGATLATSDLQTIPQQQ